MVTFVVSVSVALVISAMCSLVEAVLLSLTPSQVADLSNKNPKVGLIWRSFKTNIERPIAFILILNTSAHTIGASIAGSQFDEIWGDEWIWLFSLIFTFAMLQFTEILPKGFGVRFNRKIAPYIAKPLSVMVYATLPLIKVVHWINAPFDIEKSKPRQGNLSQWLEIKWGQSPKAGLTYAEAGFEFTVRRIRRRHVFDVSIKRQELSSAAQLPAAG